jgi:hypothetical protein
MIFQEDTHDWLIWGQRGSALINGEWVEGTGLYRSTCGKLVRFLSFALLESLVEIGEAEDLLLVVALPDFRAYKALPPVFSE